MVNQEILELREAVAELQVGLKTAVDSAHTTIHLLSYLYATRCLSTPDPLRAYTDVARSLLNSIGGATDGPRPLTGDEARDAAMRGIRHHVSQFLLTLKMHLDANVPNQS